MSFSIVTDSAANLTDQQITENNIKIVSLTYTIGGQEYLSYVEGEKTDYSEFFARVRAKESVKTSLVSYENCEKVVEGELAAGNDLLYIAFTSALSGSCQIATNCCGDLREKYPDRKIIVVDSLCASLGQGLFVYYAAKKRAEGLSLEETAAWLEENKLRFVHLFTVDDLFFLRRGGRLSGATALFGSLLNIKPLLHVDNEGRLVMTGKTRGRKASINALIERMGQIGEDLKNQPVFISHGDALEDAEYAAEQIKKLYGVKEITINYIDPVIGAHSGPGTLAIFFLGSER